MTDGMTQGVHQFFLSRKSEIRILDASCNRLMESPDTEPIDENIDQKPRKRQRTASPERKNDKTLDNAWYSQLKAAANGLPPTQASEVGPASAGKRNEGAFTIIPSAKEKKMKQSQIVIPNPTATASRTSPKASDAPATPAKALATSPKKVLKVRSDGKLSSPKSQKPEVNIKSKRKRATSKSVDVEKSKLAIIRYGIDNRRRLSLGESINHILAVSNDTPNKKRRSPKKIPPDEMTSKRAIPPRPTHPFFVAKPAQTTRAGENKLKDNVKEDTINAEASKQESQRKFTSVNKIMRRPSWTGVSGLADRPAGSGFERVPRYAGATEPPWPPQGMTHIRASAEGADDPSTKYSNFTMLHKLRKLKDASVHVQEAEDILQSYNHLAQSERLGELDGNSCSGSLRKPKRQLMTGGELQRAIWQNLECSASNGGCNRFRAATPFNDFTHHALEHLYDRVARSTTAFDRFECETHEWVHKYTPDKAEDVLQPGCEVVILRDWLRGLTINAVGIRDIEATRTRESSVGSRRKGATFKRKRRKRAEELDGFVVSSDEEADRLEDIALNVDLHRVDCGYNPSNQSVIRVGDAGKKVTDLERPANAVVISGPHGSGKTAAVYAVAQELGFEVFEISPGSRRSGKDLLDKVGDMSKNHLVNHKQEGPKKESLNENEDMLQLTESLKKDLESGRQGTMNKFFQPQAGNDKKIKAKPRGRPAKKEAPDKKPIPKFTTTQKQSLILLEEVDILYEEDKQFWTTTLELILRSRRPVIMTCINESLLPLQEMTLFAILRFSPPPCALATDYLILLACNEGHLLSRQSVSALYKAKRKDLRASIAELNCLCQMAVGDTKGGLEWLLIQSSTKNTHNEGGEKLRVVSDGTYPYGLGWISQDYGDPSPDEGLEAESELLAQVWDGWGLDLAESDDFLHSHGSPDSGNRSQELNLSKLQIWEEIYETLSTADVCAPLGLRLDQTMSLDPTQPDIPEKARSDYVEGATLLQADPRIDYTGTTTSLALVMRILARRLTPHNTPLTPTSIIRQIPTLVETADATLPITAADMRIAFTPLSPTNAISSLSVLDSILAVEIAPYIRSITAYDLRLEDQRLKLDETLSTSQTGPADTRNAKRVRTTRASRAALEGGAKATTRRERWFPNALDLSAVARTGGKTWGEVAFGTLQAVEVGSERGDVGRRSSTGSGKDSKS